MAEYSLFEGADSISDEDILNCDFDEVINILGTKCGVERRDIYHLGRSKHYFHITHIENTKINAFLSRDVSPVFASSFPDRPRCFAFNVRFLRQR